MYCMYCMYCMCCMYGMHVYVCHIHICNLVYTYALYACVHRFTSNICNITCQFQYIHICTGRFPDGVPGCRHGLQPLSRALLPALRRSAPRADPLATSTRRGSGSLTQRCRVAACATSPGKTSFSRCEMWRRRKLVTASRHSTGTLGWLHAGADGSAPTEAELAAVLEGLGRLLPRVEMRKTTNFSITSRRILTTCRTLRGRSYGASPSCRDQ